MIRDSGLGIRTTKPDPRIPRALVVFIALLLSACNGAREHAILERFFSASRVRDLTALQNVATVIFEPREQGTVLDFDITAIERKGDTEEVSVSALVRTPGGAVERRRLRVTIADGFVTSVVPSLPRP